jgi:hypothetical protein
MATSGLMKHPISVSIKPAAAQSTNAAQELLERMLAKVDGLCAERDRQVNEQRAKYPGTNKAINGPIERRFR